MAVWLEYEVDIRGCDAIFNPDGTIDWDEGAGYDVLAHFPFDTKDEAIEFVKGIRPEQLREWEEQSGWNSIEAVVFAEEVVGPDDRSCGGYNDFFMVASGEWVGDKLNGIWVGYDRIA